MKERSATWYQKGLEKAGEAVSKIKKAGEEVADAAEELYEESRLEGEDEDAAFMAMEKFMKEIL